MSSTTTADGLEPSQHTAATVAGFLYLFTMATAIFSEVFVRGRLIVPGDAVLTAQNIAASEQLFRIGIAVDLVTFASVAMLVWALYVVLSPVSRHLALLAAFLRLAETAVAAGAAVNAFFAVRLLSGATYLEAFDAGQLEALARLFVTGQGFGLQIAFVFLGLGSAVYSWLWFESRYIPQELAAWGIFASLLLYLGALFVIVFPEPWRAAGYAWMAPMAIYEVGLGLWLLTRGIQLKRITDAPRPAAVGHA